MINTVKDRTNREWSRSEWVTNIKSFGLGAENEVHFLVLFSSTFSTKMFRREVESEGALAPARRHTHKNTFLFNEMEYIPLVWNVCLRVFRSDLCTHFEVWAPHNHFSNRTTHTQKERENMDRKWKSTDRNTSGYTNVYRVRIIDANFSNHPHDSYTHPHDLIRIRISG